MTDGDLEEAYPEAAPYIREAVEEYGEQWVIENCFPEIASLGVLMDVPPVEEFPLFGEDEHEVPTEQVKRERAAAYRENLRNGEMSD